MNKVTNIEIAFSPSNTLEYRIKYVLSASGQKDIKKVIHGYFENEDEKNNVESKLADWKTLFISWELMVDEEISQDLDKSISDHHLIDKNGRAVSLFRITGYLVEN